MYHVSQINTYVSTYVSTYMLHFAHIPRERNASNKETSYVLAKSNSNECQQRNAEENHRNKHL